MSRVANGCRPYGTKPASPSHRTLDEKDSSMDRAVTVVSNRLPVSVGVSDTGELTCRRSDGGLVSAMERVLEERGGRWMGWAGICDLPKDALQPCLSSAHSSYRLDPVPLRSDERDRYYLGYANRVLWPILHGLHRHVEHRVGDRSGYLDVNRRFAYEIAACDGRGPVWIHDYHLFFVGQALRAMGCTRPLGFFLHTPFPPLEDLRKLPRYQALVLSLAAYDSIGFQTEEDRKNFVEAHRSLHRGCGAALPRGLLAGVAERASAFPISIDPSTWARRAASPAVRDRVVEIRDAHQGCAMLLGVDRLDYTKGLIEKLEGFARALELQPELVGRVKLVQLTVPSREAIPAYAEHRQAVEDGVARVNRRFRTDEWTPVRHVHGSWSPEELTARYRAADALLVTSLNDGMNLVAKEYCASQLDHRGALILSRYAGVAQELGSQALLVDPVDRESVARAIVRATRMDPPKRAERMEGLRRIVREADLRRWADSLLGSMPSPVHPGTEWATRSGARRHALIPVTSG